MWPVKTTRCWRSWPEKTTFSGLWGTWQSDYSLLPAPAFTLSRCAHSLDGATALSPRGLSFPSDGESLLAISSVGAGATLVCGAAVQESLQQARRQIWMLPFLPVKSLVQLFQNSIVV